MPTYVSAGLALHAASRPLALSVVLPWPLNAFIVIEQPIIFNFIKITDLIPRPIKPRNPPSPSESNQPPHAQTLASACRRAAPSRAGVPCGGQRRQATRIMPTLPGLVTSNANRPPSSGISTRRTCLAFSSVLWPISLPQSVRERPEGPPVTAKTALSRLSGARLRATCPAVNRGSLTLSDNSEQTHAHSQPHETYHHQGHCLRR